MTEEVARLYGYGELPSELPDVPPPTTPEDPQLAWEMKTKKLLAGFGYTELYGYSMVSVNDFLRYDLDPQDAVQIHNPLSADMTHMRTSLMPSLLNDIERNQGERPSGKLFELQRVYVKREGDLPDERTQLTMAQYGLRDVEQAFFSLKGALMSWAEKVGLVLTLDREETDPHWHPTRCAKLFVDGEDVGRIGQVAAKDQEAFGIDRPVVAAAVDFESLVGKLATIRRYEPIPEFPSVQRDLAVLLDVFTPYADVASTVEAVDDLIDHVDLVEVYQGQGIEEGKKSVTLSLTLQPREATLTSDQIDAVMAKVGKVLEKEFAGTIR